MPSGFFAFKLVLSHFRFSAIDLPVIAISYDSGATFLNDTTNSDSYLHAMSVVTGTTSAPTAKDLIFADAIINLQNSLTALAAPSTASFDLTIFPGSASDYFNLISQGMKFNADNPSFLSIEINVLTAMPNYGAVSPPAFGKVNLLRLLPYGNGDVNHLPRAKR
jgi:hypothetical protein